MYVLLAFVIPVSVPGVLTSTFPLSPTARVTIVSSLCVTPSQNVTAILLSSVIFVNLYLNVPKLSYASISTPFITTLSTL